MLKSDELAGIAPLAIELVAALRAAFDEDGPRGRKVSRGEARKIGKLSLRLGARILVDILD
jgi:hypothetical protein